MPPAPRTLIAGHRLFKVVRPGTESSEDASENYEARWTATGIRRNRCCLRRAFLERRFHDHLDHAIDDIAG